MPYLVLPPSNELRALAATPMLRRCEGCHAPINKWCQPVDLRKKPQGSPPLSETADGFLIASPAFFKRYFAEGWWGLAFRPLTNGYSLVTPERRVRLLHEDRYPYDRTGLEPGLDPTEPTRDTGLIIHHTTACDICGRYRESFGHGPAILARGEIRVEPKEFVAGDLELGEADDKAPFLLAGDEIHASHRATKIRGTSIHAPVDYQPWASGKGAKSRSGQVIPLFQQN